LEGDVLKPLFAAGIWLFAFFPSYPALCAATPVDESALQLTAEIIRQRYCAGNSKLDDIVLELRLRYRNLGSRPLILYKGSGDVYQLKISSSLADAGDGRYEVKSSRAWFSDEDAWEPSESSLNSMFVILPPRGTYETKTRARVSATREGVERRIKGSVGGGEHHLEVTTPTWRGSRDLGDSLRKKWSGRGLLWTEAVTSSPIKFVVEPKRVVADCK
jgi:hypothetical protein